MEHRRIECLDGLRGLAALWVLVGHAALLTGFKLPLISKPDLGVDLFILLSGFLMAFHYQLRAEAEPWARPATWWHFWVRRTFRIAPLYYVALAAALVLGSSLFSARIMIATVLPDQVQVASRYTDHSLANILAHVTFLFGLLPAYAYRTALPDWSIGLEMQFYAAFPFLMLVVARAGWLRSALLVGIASAACGWLIQSLAHFPMPSFLLLKLHVFLAGMLIAGALRTDRSWPFLAVGALLSIIPVGGEHDWLHLAVRALLTVGFFILVHYSQAGVRRVSSVLGNCFFRWLGELSYGAYLIHLMILIPASAYLVSTYGNELSPALRFVATLSITVPLTYGLATIGHFMIERPGQKLGRYLLRVRRRGGFDAETVKEK